MVQCEADPRQAEKVAKELGPVGVNLAKTLGIKRIYEDGVAEQFLEKGKHTPCRSVSTR